MEKRIWKKIDTLEGYLWTDGKKSIRIFETNDNQIIMRINKGSFYKEKGKIKTILERKRFIFRK